MRSDKQNKPVSYYDVLHVTPDASDDEVKKKYHMLAKVFHPDRNPKDRHMAEHRFRLINEAYANLKTREKRLAYNRLLNIHQDTLRQSTPPAAENDNLDDAVAGAQSWLAGFASMFWPASVRVKSAGGKNNV